MSTQALPALLELFRPRLRTVPDGKYTLSSLRDDIFGGLTAAIVALPLALAFGVVSGVGPVAGMYGAIAVGFFAAVFGGTPSQISGPTGPMTVVMSTVIATHAKELIRKAGGRVVHLNAGRLVNMPEI